MGPTLVMCPHAIGSSTALPPRAHNPLIYRPVGRIGMINSGGASGGETDMADAVWTAIVNKRAGGSGLISGRKAFQRPMKDGAQLLNRIQDVYLDKNVTVA